MKHPEDDDEEEEEEEAQLGNFKGAKSGQRSKGYRGRNNARKCC
jgi:hypothetical protein